MQPQELTEQLGIPLQQAADPQRLLRYDSRNTYSLNEAGYINGLNLRGNRLTDEQIAFIWGIPGLEALNLSENELSAVHIPAACTDLRYLNLSDNKRLVRLSFAKEGLPRLEYLWAEECALTEVHFPAGLTSLHTVYLRKNQLARLSFAGDCPGLELLDASENKLQRFRLPAGFLSLARLYLNSNQLVELAFASILPALDTLHLRNNRLPPIQTGFLTPFPGLVSLYLAENPLQDTLRGQLEEDKDRNCLDIIRSYLRELADDSEADNECKILLIGNGKAGKSCLAARLIDNTFEEEWCSTDGIVLRPFPHRDFQFMVWDFGGQDIYHATHRLFMQSNAIYLTVWDWSLEPERTEFTEVEENGQLQRYENFSLDYWLDYARHLGWDEDAQQFSPVIVVQSKIKDHGVQDLPAIRDKYRDLILNFRHVDSKYPDPDENGYTDLLTSIRLAASRTQIGMQIPKSWSDLRQAIRKKQEAGEEQLSLDDYLKMAKTLENPLGVLENWLVKTGVVFYRKGLFGDAIILDQQWAIDAVYTIFKRQAYHYQAFQRDQGRFSGQDLMRIWLEAGKARNEAECELFLSFMLSCEICFETTEKKEDDGHLPLHKRTFLAPQLTEKTKPRSVAAIWTRQQAYYWQYRYAFLHDGMIQSFIVRASTIPGVEVLDIWRTGIQLVLGDQLALVEAERKTRSIHIRISRGGWSLLEAVKTSLQKDREPHLKELVGVDGRIFVDWKELQTLPAKVSMIRDEYDEWVDVEPFRALLPEAGMSAPQKDGAGSRHADEMVRGIDSRIDFSKDAGPATTRGRLPDLTSDPSFSPEANLQPAEAPHKILFVAANPKDTTRLQADVEYRRLKAELARGRAREHYRFLDVQIAATIEELLRAMNDQPQLVHFAGHGQEDGLVITTEGNLSEVLSEDALWHLFHPHTGSLRVVILNACYSARQARAISECGIYVVGHNLPVYDGAAINFSVGFYNGLGEGKGFAAALNDAFTVLQVRHPKAIPHIEVWKDGKKLPI